MSQRYYYKATRDNGVSGHDSNFVYHLGIVTHPAPDKKDTSACGVGIHLAKTLTVAQRFVQNATDFYLAEAGVIYGEDSDIIRCGSCRIVKKLHPVAVKNIIKREITFARGETARQLREKAAKRMLGYLYETGGLAGKDWLNKHMFDISQSDIDKLTLEIKTPTRSFTLHNKMKVKDRKYVLQGAIA